MNPSVKNAPGVLVMAATHIGCVEDTPSRTLAAIKNADLLIFEEDRPARLLLKLAGIHKNYIKFNEHQPEDALRELRITLKSGKNAVYVSDQGCPTLADPGKQILETAYSTGATIRVIPGPSSITAALSACPFSIQHFFFQGFLSAETEEREAQLRLLTRYENPIVILDTPYRLEKVLAACERLFEKKRKAFLALDISGNDENYLLGTFSQLGERVKGVKVNFVLIINGC